LPNYFEKKLIKHSQSKGATYGGKKYLWQRTQLAIFLQKFNLFKEKTLLTVVALG
jgi:ABC-type polar amino acid transport system ATPase subunit